MRHGIGYRKLNKTSEHRKALFKNMLNSLIKYEQIITTLPKAKELKPQIDKVITIGKKNILSNKKRLFSKLQNKKSVTKVFDELSKRYSSRKGGYCRVLKAGFRTGDDAPMAVIELVDRNPEAKKVDKPKKIAKKESEQYIQKSGLSYTILRIPLVIGNGGEEFERFVDYVKSCKILQTKYFLQIYFDLNDLLFYQ